MPRRDDRFRLEDILDATRKIEKYITGVEFEDFRRDEMRVDAVVRNLEVIGEAATNITEATMALCPKVDWKAVRAIRVFLAHKYFGVSVETVWETVQSDLPPLQVEVREAVRLLTRSDEEL